MHPMYQHPTGMSLRQGDILDAALVRERLRGHLDYFAEKPYFVAFCVMTQSCDLECDRRVDFATLAVVRTITDAFSRHVPLDSKATKTMLGYIINHNLNKRAYFYLHPNPVATLSCPSVADLRVCFSISLRQVDGHYDKLLEARRASLRPDYASALGWMASQVYGRVATTDWKDLDLQPRSAEEYVDLLWSDIHNAKSGIVDK